MFGTKKCYCPSCGRAPSGLGRIGMSQQCECGAWIPATSLNKVRYFWIAEAAFTFALAAFLIAFAVFYFYLPSNNWERLFSPYLQVPAMATFIVSYKIFVQNMKKDDKFFFKYYSIGIIGTAVGIVLSSIIAIASKLNLL